MEPTKKTWLIDQDLVTQARRIYGARTETETVTRALQDAIVQDEISRAFRRNAPKLAGIEEMFPDSVTSQQ